MAVSGLTYMGTVGYIETNLSGLCTYSCAELRFQLLWERAVMLPGRRILDKCFAGRLNR